MVCARAGQVCEDKFTPWMQRCSGVHDINVIWKHFMETFAKVAHHIVGRRAKSKPSSGSWWTNDLMFLQSLKKSVRKAGQKCTISTIVYLVHWPNGFWIDMQEQFVC